MREVLDDRAQAGTFDLAAFLRPRLLGSRHAFAIAFYFVGGSRRCVQKRADRCLEFGARNFERFGHHLHCNCSAAISPTVARLRSRSLLRSSIVSCPVLRLFADGIVLRGGGRSRTAVHCKDFGRLLRRLPAPASRPPYTQYWSLQNPGKTLLCNTL